MATIKLPKKYVNNQSKEDKEDLMKEFNVLSKEYDKILKLDKETFLSDVTTKRLKYIRERMVDIVKML